MAVPFAGLSMWEFGGFAAVGPLGLEPRPVGLKVRCSIQLELEALAGP